MSTVSTPIATASSVTASCFRLYGLFLNQATHYFRKYTKDPLIIKCIVRVVFVRSMARRIVDHFVRCRSPSFCTCLPLVTEWASCLLREGRALNTFHSICCMHAS